MFSLFQEALRKLTSKCHHKRFPMPYIWLNLVIKYFALSYIFQTGHFKNISFDNGKFVGPMDSSKLSKNRFWDFFKSGEIVPVQAKSTESQTNGDSYNRKLTDFLNVSADTIEEDLLSIRDLDNLLFFSNSSSEHNNITTGFENTTNPHPNVHSFFTKTTSEVQIQYSNLTRVNSSIKNVDFVKNNKRDKLEQLIQNITSRYLSKFVVGEESDVSREETDDVVEKGRNSGGESKPETEGWPVKHAAEVPGDLILGGLMMVHEREDSITCGPIMPQGGIQALETMLYTLDVINSQPQRPFTLGAHILDDCDKDTYGLEMAVDFIKG